MMMMMMITMKLNDNAHATDDENDFMFLQRTKFTGGFMLNE